MAKILGNLSPDDDYTHPLGPESNFNESMYFNFYDPGQELGGWLRLGNRANEGYAEMSVCLYLPDGRVLFAFKRPAIESNAAFQAGGLHFEVLEPTQSLRTGYAGSALCLGEPREMADPRRAFANNPRQKIRLELTHDAVGPMFGGARHAAEEKKSADQQFGKAHYEQHMQVSGELELDGARLRIDGFGLRDHSWGPRYWQAIHRYEWLTLNFGADLGAMVSIIQRDPEGKERSAGGVLVRGMELTRIVEAEIDAEYEAGTPYHKSLVARVTTEDGEALEIEGRVKSFIPLRNRREGLVTHIGEGMTEWRLGDRTGYGLSEFLRQVPAA